MVHFIIIKRIQMIKEISVTQYCEKYGVARHSVHRRIGRIEKTGLPVNNIVAVRRLGPKIILIDVDTSIRFKKR
jgi:hypothetical protein